MTFRLSCLFSIHQTRKSSGLKFGKTEYLSMGIRFQIKRSGLRFRPTRLFNQTKMHSFRHCPKPFADKFSFSPFFLFTLLQIYKSKYLVSDTHICPVMIIEVEVSANDILGVLDIIKNTLSTDVFALEYPNYIEICHTLF